MCATVLSRCALALCPQPADQLSGQFRKEPSGQSVIYIPVHRAYNGSRVETAQQITPIWAGWTLSAA
jgi:hypothetical protein